MEISVPDLFWLHKLHLAYQNRLFQKKLQSSAKPYKLHLACGNVRYEGWINVDYLQSSSKADVCWDLREGIPTRNASCSLIYCEHFLEHLSVDHGVAFLKECHRVLIPTGVLRIAMPSLDILIKKTYEGNWKEQDWLTWKEHEVIKTKAEMLNIAFREWGHKWLYDREELYRRLNEAGFEKIEDVNWGYSGVDELRNLETRRDSLLICEAER